MERNLKRNRHWTSRGGRRDLSGVHFFIKDKLVSALGGGLILLTAIALFTQVPEYNEQFTPPIFSSHVYRNESGFLKNKDEPHKTSTITGPFSIELGGSQSVETPRNELDPPKECDFGSLNFELLTNDHDQRLIWDTGRIASFATHAKHQDYVSIMDDDYFLQDEYLNGYLGVKKNHVEPRDCRYPKVERFKLPNCNNLHEIGFESMVRSNMAKLVGHGEYKQVFSFKSDLDNFTFKEAIIPDDDEDYTASQMEEYAMDGITSAAVVPHPRMVDFYGYCGLSQLNEVMNRGDAESLSVIYDRCEGNITMSPDAPFVSVNDLTPIQKIVYALDMAEGVALLHNSPLGVIVHDDIQLSQFMVNAKGRLQLNDFNRATIMMYSEKEGGYCKFKNGVGPGDWRSPEEYINGPLDEKIDIFSLGNNLYSMLTGVYPFPDVCSYHEAAERIKNGTRAFLDPRWKTKSNEEGKIVDLIQKCWEEDPAMRPTIGEIVSFLEHVIEEYLEENKAKQNVTGTEGKPTAKGPRNSTD